MNYALYLAEAYIIIIWKKMVM